MRLLKDSRLSAMAYGVIRLELEHLQETLEIITTATEAYRHTPLARSLNTLIMPDLAQCQEVIEGLLCTIKLYRQCLIGTIIGSFWPQVLWAGWDVDYYQRRLLDCQTSLGQFIIALRS